MFGWLVDWLDGFIAWGLTEPTFLPPYIQLVGSVYDPEISPAPPMSPELTTWLDQSNTPVVYVSTGTNVRLRSDQLSALVCTAASCRNTVHKTNTPQTSKRTNSDIKVYCALY